MRRVVHLWRVHGGGRVSFEGRAIPCRPRCLQMNPYKRGTLLDPKKTWIWLVQRRRACDDCSWTRTAAALWSTGCSRPCRATSRPSSSRRGAVHSWAASGSCASSARPTCLLGGAGVVGHHGELRLDGDRRDLLNAVSVDLPRRDVHDARRRRCFQTNKRGGAEPVTCLLARVFYHILVFWPYGLRPKLQ